jgi:Dullard-like phosphatase family protein
VFGLDGTLVHVDWEKRSEEDIDVVLQLEDQERKPAYLCLRPYLMTFLKKMARVFDIVVFSDRSHLQTQAILDILDPFKEIIKTWLSKENCIEVKRGVTTKDLRVLGGELSQVLLVDNEPYNYLYQVDNAVPILPFHRGSDDQLYSLEKYLLEAARTPDLCSYNRNYFKLGRYSQFSDVLLAIKHLYILER